MIIIGGTTASGKSELAIKTAKLLDGEIISADSMQIYKRMDIGTAKLTLDQRQGVPHHLIDIVEPESKFTVAEFKTAAENIICKLKKRKTAPIITGGTGLYINSLIYDYSLSEQDLNLRNELINEADKYGKEYMYNKLLKIDNQAAEKIHSNNLKRVIRAIEVKLLSGHSILEKNDKQTTAKHLMYAIDYDRQCLYERINKRVDIMMNEGLVFEIESLIESGINFECQSMQAIGYKEFKDYFDKKIDLKTTVELIKQHTRNYAKRQITWFSKIPTCKWIKSDKIEFLSEKISEEYYKLFNNLEI